MSTQKDAVTQHRWVSHQSAWQELSHYLWTSLASSERPTTSAPEQASSAHHCTSEKNGPLGRGVLRVKSWLIFNTIMKHEKQNLLGLHEMSYNHQSTHNQFLRDNSTP